MAEVALGLTLGPDRGGRWEISGARHGDTANTTTPDRDAGRPRPGQVVR